MRSSLRFAVCFLLGTWLGFPAHAGPASTAIRETAEYVLTKFGRGSAGQTVEDLVGNTKSLVTRHGDAVLPLVRTAGHDGIAALERAGDQAPNVLRLYAARGEHAVWIITEPRKLSLFLKYGDAAAEAMIRHPGVAEDLIGRFGDGAAVALNGLSKQSAQRLGMLAEDGLLNATPRSTELLSVARQYGDGAMEFIWKNKGSFAIASVLGTFLADPQSYFTGAKQLIMDPVITPIVGSVNWTWLIVGILAVLFLPFIVRRLVSAYAALRRGPHAGN